MKGNPGSTPQGVRTADGLETGPARIDAARLAGLFALGGSAVFVAMVPPVSDHAYQFYMAGRVLAGARLYVDIGAADMHPPLFTWLAMAVTLLGRPIGLSGLTLYLLLVPLVVFWAVRQLWRLGLADGWVLAVLAFALLTMAGPYAGQGEHLALVLALPWMAGTASAASGRPMSRPAAITAGIAAGLGLAMKPHFALVWIGVELWLARRNGRRSLLRAESVTIASVFVLYVAITALITPTVFTLIPWVAPLYAQFAPTPVLEMLLDVRMLLLVTGVAAGFAGIGARSRFSPIARVLAIAALAMTVAVLLQGKGWGYHWYPVTALSAILIGLALHDRLGRLRAIATIALAAVAIAGASMQVDRTARLLAGAPVLLPQLMEAVEQHATGEPIVALSYLLQTGFPLVNLTGTDWASPYAHLWMVPALYADAFAGRAPVRYRDTGKWVTVEQDMFDRLWERIARDDPAITIVQAPFANGFDMRAYFETDVRFRERFVRSPVLDTIGSYIILGRPDN